MPKLTEVAIGRIKERFAVDGSVAAVMRNTGFSRNSVNKALAFDENQQARRAARRAPIRILKRRQLLQRLAKLRVKKQHRTWPRFGSSKALRAALQSAHGIRVSSRTVIRDLHALGLHARVRPKVPTREFRDRSARLKFARKHVRDSVDNIVFSDESWLSCNENTGRIQWCRSGEQPLPLERKARWNVPSIMVWGAVGVGFKGPLVILPSKRLVDGEVKVFRLDAEHYIRRCLTKVVPLLRGKVFQQDGARSHASWRTKSYLARKNISWMEDFPPYSPDFNMIEPIWKELNERVGQMCPLTQEELIVAARIAWEAIPQAVIDAHVRNFRRTLSRVVRNRS